MKIVLGYACGLVAMVLFASSLAPEPRAMAQAQPSTAPVTEVIHKTEKTPQEQLYDLAITVLSTLVSIGVAAASYYLIPLLKRKGEAATTESQNASLDQLSKIKQQLKAFLYGTAQNIVESEFPKLADDIIHGRIKTQDEIHARLASFGRQLKIAAVTQFKLHDVDLIEIFGENYINALIERIANAVSPFPGMATADALLNKNGANQIKQFGVDYTRRLNLTRPEGSPVTIPGTDSLSLSAGPDLTTTTTTSTPDV